MMLLSQQLLSCLINRRLKAVGITKVILTQWKAQKLCRIHVCSLLKVLYTRNRSKKGDYRNTVLLSGSKKHHVQAIFFLILII